MAVEIFEVVVRWRERIDVHRSRFLFPFTIAGSRWSTNASHHACTRFSNYPAQSSRNGGRQHIGAHLHLRASSQHVKHFRRLAKPDREVKLIQSAAARRILLDLYTRVPACVFPRFSGFPELRGTPVQRDLRNTADDTLARKLFVHSFRTLGADVVHGLLFCSQGSGALRSHLPASMFRARIDGPDSEPTDTLDHTNRRVVQCPDGATGMCVIVEGLELSIGSHMQQDLDFCEALSHQRRGLSFARARPQENPRSTNSR